MEGSVAEQQPAVGCVLAITTFLDERFEGKVIAFDLFSDILVLQDEETPPSSKGETGGVVRRNIRLLKANCVKHFELIRREEDPLDLSKCFLDLAGLQAREESAIRQAEIEAEKIGIGVTDEAQSIFDSLSKTLPVRWDKTTIVVMNAVRVSSPYLPENVIGGTPAANERVKKVLEFERKRLVTRDPLR